MSGEDELLDGGRWIITQADAGVRLDHFLRDQDLNITRSRLKKLINTGYVTIDDEVVVRPAVKVREGDEIVLTVPPPEALSACPEEMSLDIRHEDDTLLVVNKPQDMVVHPAPGHSSGTLINGILFGRTARGGDPLRPGIVHRLDKDTSGLMVVAKTEQVHAHLAQQFHDHTVDRRYRVLVAGVPPQKGEWKTLYGRYPGDRRRFSSRVERGKVAVSRFVTAERFHGAAMLKVTLRTGRTHQVRVHCHDHGLSVLGDPWYGPRHLSPELFKIHKGLAGQALHAELLGFEHPVTGKRLCFESDPPAVFQDAVQALRQM